ncbi:hypothetical protein OY671_009335, partial [Metschnikowia pulcherrima]
FGLSGHESLKRLAPIVRGADTGRPDLVPEADGLLAASLGSSRMYADDQEQLEAGMLLYDAFCAAMSGAVTESPVGSEAGTPDHGITFGEAVRVWARIASSSFGGPAGQIAVMHRILVEEKHWIGEERFSHALNYCMLSPGPEAQQLAAYIGWSLHKTKGGSVAGGSFVSPGFLAISGLSYLYVSLGHV